MQEGKSMIASSSHSVPELQIIPELISLFFSDLQGNVSSCTVNEKRLTTPQIASTASPILLKLVYVWLGGKLQEQQ